MCVLIEIILLNVTDQICWPYSVSPLLLFNLSISFGFSSLLLRSSSTWKWLGVNNLDARTSLCAASSFHFVKSSVVTSSSMSLHTTWCNRLRGLVPAFLDRTQASGRISLRLCGEAEDVADVGTRMKLELIWQKYNNRTELPEKVKIHNKPSVEWGFTRMRFQVFERLSV